MADQPDFIARMIGGGALIVSILNFCYTVYSKNKDAFDKNAQAKRDIVANDFSDDVRAPMIAALDTLSDAVSDIDVHLSKQDASVDNTKEALAKITSDNINSAMNKALDIAARCHSNPSLKHITLDVFLSNQQDALLEKLNSYSVACRTIATALKAAADARVAVATADANIRGELSKIHANLKIKHLTLKSNS